MKNITFDFSRKDLGENPRMVSGIWHKDEQGVITITWPDANVWTMLVVPTAPWNQPAPEDDHVGLFIDPSLYQGPLSFVGTRLQAEFPAHELTAAAARVAIVGSRAIQTD